MADAGADFREILAHYYPNTVIITLRRPSPW
jgi:peptidoglycan hydrolase-like amidase